MKELWKELRGIREAWKVPWVIGRGWEFNVVRYINEWKEGDTNTQIEKSLLTLFRVWI